MDALDSVKPLNDSLAAAVEGLVHLVDGVEGARDSFKCCQLGDVVDVRGHVRLQIGCRLGDVGGGNHPAHAPAGHGVGLGHTVENDGVLSQGGHSLDDGGEGHAVVGEVLINFIGEHDDALLQRPLANSLGFFGGIDRTGGVRGGYKNQGLGGGGVGCLQHVGGDLVFLVGSREDLDRVAASQADSLGVGSPVGGGQQHIVALINDGGKGLVDGLLAAVGHDDLGGVNIDTGITLGLLNDCLLEGGQACGLGVAEVGGVLESLAGGVHNVVGGGEVGLARTKANHRASLRLEGLSFSVNDEGGRGGDSANAA